MNMASGQITSALRKSQDGRRALSTTELDAVARSPLFAGVTRQWLREHICPSGELNLRLGTALFDAGHRYSEIHLLVSGRLAIFLEEDAKIPVAYVLPGECLGEIALIDDEAAADSVIAVEPSHLLAMALNHLWQLMHDEPRIALNLMETLADRARKGKGSAAGSNGHAAKPNMISSIDPITGLHNRRWCNDMFLRQIDRCARKAEPVCMAMIDIDRFKAVNDTFGPQAGDLVLAQIARIMQKQFRPGDLLARYGGEEFAVLLPGTKLKPAMAALERLRLAVDRAQTSVAQRTTVKVRVSAGVAQWREGLSLDDLARHTETALLDAKSNGRNCVMAHQDD